MNIKKIFSKADKGQNCKNSLMEQVEDKFRDCCDFCKREILIGGEGGIPAMFYFLDGMVSSIDMGDFVIRPLTDKSRFGNIETESAAAELMLKGGVYDHAAIRRDKAEDIFQDLVSGFCTVIFYGGGAVSFEVRTRDKRSIDQPKEEKVVNGSKDAFVEIMRVNTMLVRRKLRTADLKIRLVEAGSRSKTQIAIVYLDRFTNKAFVDETERRLKSINTDEVLTTSVIEENVTDIPSSPFPQMITTERPDKFCLNILEGRVGILADGLPVGFLVPATFSQFMKVPEDHAMHFAAASMLTVMRYCAFFLAMVLPAFYVSVAMYHQEMIPVQLLQSIIDAKQSVPFPTAFEALAMLIAFELLQEAGLRLPNPIGQTVSIIGALIVGQSAVEAKVVSPVIVVVIALSGICGYTMPNQEMGAALRILRFFLVLTAIFAGMFGLAVGITMIIYHMASIESFGVPYMSPFAGADGKHKKRALLRYPMTRKQNREPALKTEDEK